MINNGYSRKTETEMAHNLEQVKFCMKLLSESKGHIPEESPETLVPYCSWKRQTIRTISI